MIHPRLGREPRVDEQHALRHSRGPTRETYGQSLTDQRDGEQAQCECDLCPEAGAWLLSAIWRRSKGLCKIVEYE